MKNNSKLTYAAVLKHKIVRKGLKLKETDCEHICNLQNRVTVQMVGYL